MNTVFATKKYMSQVFTPEGIRLPVTIVKSGVHTVIKNKTSDTDGYWSVQFGFGERTFKNLTKPQIGHLKGALKDKKEAPKFLKEVKLDKESTYEVGASMSPQEILETGDLVNVTGVSKGKGFAGGVKRHGFHGGPKTHGQSDRHRAPGSIGQTTTPGRVFKGKRMAGRMGGEQNTIKNLIVLKIDDVTGEIILSGLVPGAPGTFLTIKKVGKSKKQYTLVTDKTELPEVDEAAPVEAAEEELVEAETPEAPQEEVKAEAEEKKEEKENGSKE